MVKKAHLDTGTEIITEDVRTQKTSLSGSKQSKWFSAIISLGVEENSTTDKMSKRCGGVFCVYTDTMLRL